ncbi:MAG: sensor histidine kinase [Gemmatimonadaceae bacterium]
MDREESRPGRGAGFWLLSAGIFALVFVLRFAYQYLDDLTRGDTGTMGLRLLEESTGAATAFVLFVGVMAVERRWPVDRGHWRRSLPVHLATFACFTVGHTTLMAASREVLAPLLGLGAYDYGRMSVRYFMEAPNDAIGYAVALVALALGAARRTARERARRTAELERSLSRAELQNLRLRLQPHFLFNALNTIAARMYEDPAAADAMIGHLSDLLRHSLRSAQHQEVPLADEMALLDSYLAITRERFGERLTVAVHADQDTLGAAVPSLVLQPLVENAVRHGRASRTGEGHIHVRTTRHGDTLLLVVENDAHTPDGTTPARPAPAPDPSPLVRAPDSTGLGLAATADRLRLLYGPAGRCDAGPIAGGGFRVTLGLPFVEFGAVAARGEAPEPSSRPRHSPPFTRRDGRDGDTVPVISASAPVTDPPAATAHAHPDS